VPEGEVECRVRAAGGAVADAPRLARVCSAPGRVRRYRRENPGHQRPWPSPPSPIRAILRPTGDASRKMTAISSPGVLTPTLAKMQASGLFELVHCPHGGSSVRHG